MQMRSVVSYMIQLVKINILLPPFLKSKKYKPYILIISILP